MPAHLRALLPLVVLDVGALSLARLVFWQAFAAGEAPLSRADLLRALSIGLRFDLRLVLIVLAPVAVFGGARWVGVTAGGSGRRMWFWYLGLATAAAALFYAFDFGHYAYLRTRLAATAVGFLANPLISLRMIWESYPVVWGTAGIVLLVALHLLLFGRLVRRAGAVQRPRPRRWARWATATVLVVLWLGGIYGKLSWYPLRWSDAFFSTDDFASALALNPVLYFFDTLKNREAGYDVAAVREAHPLVAGFLGIDAPNGDGLALARRQRPRPRVTGRPNVVIVLLESFAWSKCGLSGNALAPTPRLDDVASRSLSFTRFYVPSFGTARSVFALLTGIPDVETHETSTRNPLIVRQQTIVNAFDGYETFYFLGGSLNWGNIRGVLLHNIPGLRVFEEGDYDAERVDVWGVPDIALFEKANAVLREVPDRPFFAIIQTSGNHRPYTIPEHSRGFRLVSHGEEEIRAAGFISNEELNSFRLVDHSLGTFLDDAARERYFDNTIFVLLGDHGYQNRAGNVPAWEDGLGLTRFHVPLVIFAPGLGLGPQVIENVASELDVLPTLASLAGVTALNTTLGRDLLDPRFDGSRYAFTIGDHFTRPRIGLVSDRFYLRTYADGGDPELFLLEGAGDAENVAASYPEKARSMAALCRGLLETSHYLLYHNGEKGRAERGVVRE